MDMHSLAVQLTNAHHILPTQGLSCPQPVKGMHKARVWCVG